jgi:signal transduction histidine kinase
MNQLQRIGLLGRIVLIMTTALAALIVVTLATIHWRPSPSPFDTHYPRLRQVAGIVDLMRALPVDRYPAVLRAANGEKLRVRIVPRVPPAPGLAVAPRLTAKLRGFAHPGSGTIAYTDPHEARADQVHSVEGYLIRATWPMPDGRVLLLDHIANVSNGDPDLLGIPSALWIGGVGVLVAALAILALVQEVRPLRRLVRAVRDFDGERAIAPVPVGGATEVRQLIAAVDAMQRRVTQLIAERTLTIGAISHDLRTLLTRLHLRAATLADETTRERIEADLAAMQALVDDALAFARGTRGSPVRQPLDLADLVASELAERAALGLVPIVRTDLADVPISGDADALRRVVANLLENAAKFTRSTIQITTGCERDRCVLRVDDDGNGIPEDERQAIFDPFYRVEGSRNRATGGSGLGLAIARQIVEAHGGTLSVETAPLGGARFTVSLPKPGAQ